MEPKLGIDNESRKEIINTLNTLLAGENVLYQKIRNYHWNVTGPQFHSLHEVFEVQYTELATSIDELAERVRQLGGFATGTYHEYIEMSSVKEDAPGKVLQAHAMVSNAVDSHEVVIRALREAIEKAEDAKDTGTADFLTGKMEDHEKMAWMLRAFLEGKSVQD